MVINTLTERSGGCVALVTTEGFRDVLEIGRANRPDMYNHLYAKQRQFIPRERRYEVQERVSYKGDVLTPLNEDHIRDLAEKLRENDVEVVAICFLHSYIPRLTRNAVPSCCAKSSPTSSLERRLASQVNGVSMNARLMLL